MAGTASAATSASRRLILSVMSSPPLLAAGLRRARFDPSATLHPPAVDDEVLRRAHPAVVGRQKQHHARDVRRVESIPQALALMDLPLALRAQPQLDLPIGHDPTGQHAIDPDLLR